MKFRFLVAIILINLITQVSCGTKQPQKKEITHEQEVEFYITVWSSNRRQVKLWNTTIDAFNELPWHSNHYNGEPLADSLVDAGISMAKEYTVAMDSLIKIINGIEEVDSEINLKTKLLEILNMSKEVWKDDAIKCAEVYRKGAKNNTEKDDALLHAFGYSVDEILNKMDILQRDLKKYFDHHKITSSDIKSYDFNE